MKLLSIYADNYGVFHGRHVDFRDQLQVIYGPNEAGKSTLLQLIRDSLFGFPHQSPYRWRSSSKMAATIRMELRNGQCVQFRRQKGKPDDVNGSFESSSTKIQNDADVVALLSGANKETFTNIFGFSLEELTAGQNSLKDSGLGDLLLTGGVQGLDQFRFVEKELAEQQAEIFAPRAKTRKFNVVLDAIDQSKKNYQEQRVAPQEFDALTDQRSVSQSRVSSLESELLTIRQQEQRLEKCLKVLPLSRSIALLEEEISQLSIPTELTPRKCLELQKLIDKRDALIAEIEEVQQYFNGIDNESSVVVDEKLLKHAAGVQRLARETEKIRNFLSEQATHTTQQQHLDRDIQQQLNDLGEDWSVDRVRGVSTSVPIREQIQDFVTQRTELDKSLAKLQSRAPDFEQQLAQVTREIEELPISRSMTGLEDLLERSEDYLRDTNVLADLQGDLSNLYVELDNLSRELGSPLGSERSDWQVLPVPLKATVQEWQDRLAIAKQNYLRTVDQVNDKREELKDLQVSLAEFDQLHPSLDREQLIQQRRHRDVGLDLLIEQIEDGKNNQSEIPYAERVREWLNVSDSQLTEELREAIAQTDHLADLQYVQAEFVAKRDQLVHRIEVIESLLIELGEAESSAKKNEQQLTMSWRKIWIATELEPLGPTEMLEWLQTFDRYKTKSQQRAEIESKSVSLRTKKKAFEHELARTFPESAESPKQSLKAAQRELQDAQRASEDKMRLQREHGQLSQKLEEIEAKRFELSLTLGEFENKQRTLFKQVGFPEQWSLNVAQRVMGLIVTIQQKLQGLDEVSLVCSRQQEEIDTFTKAATELSTALDEPFVGDPCDVIDRLYDSLQNAQSQQQQQLQDLATADEQKRRLLHLKSQLDSVEQSLNEQSASLESKDHADLLTLLKQAEHQEQLTKDLEQQRKTIRLEGVDVSLLREEFGEDEANVLSRKTELELQVERCDSDYRTALKELGAVQHQIDQLVVKKSQHSSAGELSHHRTRLNELVHSWAALTISQRVMRQAQQRYETENRPEMMRVVSDYLERMTLGRYVRIQSDREKQKTIVVVDENGEAKLPNELSTGTREQLYLAVRLGYLSHYSESHEPLPLVMDDVLVNFDDARALQTLKVLQECSREHQVLLLTCHTRTVEMMKRLNSEARILELVPGSLNDEPLERPKATVIPKRKRQEDDHAQPALFPNS